MEDVHDKKTGRVKNQRELKVMKHCDPCECKFSANGYPAASPELNPAENAQSQLRQIVEKFAVKKAVLIRQGQTLMVKWTFCVAPSKAWMQINSIGETFLNG
jgi:hypothetical protein